MLRCTRSRYSWVSGLVGVIVAVAGVVLLITYLQDISCSERQNDQMSVCRLPGQSSELHIALPPPNGEAEYTIKTIHCQVDVLW